MPLAGDWSTAAVVGQFAGDDALDVLVPYVFGPNGSASRLVNLANAPTIAAADVVLDESAGAATFVVTRAGDLSGTSTVSYQTVDATATAPGDYAARRGTLSFSSGQTCKRVTITDTTATATISDDD